MDALWMLAEPDRCYRVPDEKLIINAQGELLPGADSYRVEVQPSPATDFATLCEQVDIIILVVGRTPLNTQWLQLLPTRLPKVGFLNERSHPEVRLQLTLIGVDGYITAAMHQTDFAMVLQKISEDKQAVSHLQDEIKNYSSIAFTAMSSASEMGTVAIFAEKVQAVMDLQRLAALIQVCLGELGLEGVTQFVFDKEESIFPSDVPVSYLKLLHSARESEARIISHERFILFSFEHVQLLVTNAPVRDEERYGRLRDVLAHVVSIAEARAKTLKVNTLLKAQQDNTRMVMMLLEMASVDNRNSVKEIMTELSESLRLMATGFDLNMKQEAQLLQLSERALNSLEGLQEATSAVEEHFRSLLTQLDAASSLLQAPSAAESWDEDAAGRIELF